MEWAGFSYRIKNGIWVEKSVKRVMTVFEKIIIFAAEIRNLCSRNEKYIVDNIRFVPFRNPNVCGGWQ